MKELKKEFFDKFVYMESPQTEFKTNANEVWDWVERKLIASQLAPLVIPKIADVEDNYKNTYIKTLAKYLRQDPQAGKFETEYEFEEYLCELLDKDSSVLEGLINALEIYLDK